MAQSLASLLVHLVFSTKNREPWISPATESKLHAYMAGTLKTLGCDALAINGMPDHVHLLFRLSRT